MKDEPKRKAGDGTGNWVDLPFAPSLRDYFAGQALIGILSNSIIEKMRQEELDGYFSDDAQIKAIAETCGDYADAMIKEREK